MNYEHKVVDLYPKDDSIESMFGNTFNRMQATGWELVAVNTYIRYYPNRGDIQGYFMFFKRAFNTNG